MIVRDRKNIEFLTSFDTTESSSDTDFSMSLICGPTTRDSGCLSGGSSARVLLGIPESQTVVSKISKAYIL